MNHFTSSTRRALKARGLTIVSIQAVPAFDGDAYFSGTAYLLSNGRMASFLEVLRIAGK